MRRNEMVQCREIEAMKFNSGIKSAGTRVRKHMQNIKDLSGELACAGGNCEIV